MKDLDHHVWKLLKHYGLLEKKILVSLSGGVDSVALFLSLLKTHDKSLLGVFHFHHGIGGNQIYRDEALLFCEKLTGRHEVPFFFEKAKGALKSEADFREARFAAIESVKNQHNFAVVALGHHRDDLLETRMMRLIRGTGGQGLAAMREWDQGMFRPLLSRAKLELEAYVADENAPFLADPSNNDLDPLRNWLRKEWLPQLEVRSVGSVGVLARSLETIVDEISTRGDLLSSQEDFGSQGLQRSFYLTLTLSEQKRLLAQYLFALGKRDFSQSHIEEIQKRLDNSQKVITFQVAGLNWEINAQQIKVQS
ncbi:tRNA(Ile)-lysidine synthetase [Bdellovibrio bacteriovorus]|uniref:tRNA(Ile)-lysidine synthase n=1 Tax=Bdellovibrio bacteriovorus TaxID=959 RepID=A0A150WJS4_BDEBC|nr:tRNA lysidine(34) synthetase TilS [Bdellovibrio bacteriovorus]KYG64009.1 tRNA(Ile)-lysidine synthetase [Bdellovibrio bacteriovorus]